MCFFRKKKPKYLKYTISNVTNSFRAPCIWAIDDVDAERQFLDAILHLKINILLGKAIQLETGVSRGADSVETQVEYINSLILYCPDGNRLTS